MTRVEGFRRNLVPNSTVAGLWLVAGLLLLGATVAVPAGPLAGAPNPTSSGLSLAGNVTCPSSSGNTSGPFISTNTSQGTAPLAVQFCLFSPQAVRSAFWDFGDGAGLNGTNVTHVYTQVGQYHASVSVNYTAGGTTGLGTTITVTNSSTTNNSTIPLGVREFVSLVNGSAPLTINLSANVTNARGAVHYVWSWSVPGFGFSNSSGIPNYSNMTFILPWPGTYNVSVNATDTLGDTGEASMMVHAAGNRSLGPFVVAATATPNPTVVGATVHFNATVRNASSGPISWEWSFGDGGNGSGQTPQHVYTHNGTYTATVWANDGLNLSSASVAVVVNATPPSGNATALSLGFNATPTYATAPVNVTLSAVGSGGTLPYTLLICATPSVCSFQVSNWTGGFVQTWALYTSAGNYTATATVTDANGNQTVSTVPIIVTNGPPLNVSVLESSLTGPAPLAVGFLAVISGGVAPYTIQWNWGDGSLGSSVTGGIVAHAYTTAGNFSPTLRVTDTVGHNVTLALGTVRVTAAGQLPAVKGGLLPSGGSPGVTLEYLGIAIAGALMSGLALGYYLRHHRRQEEGAKLVTALETNANRSAGPPRSER